MALEGGDQGVADFVVGDGLLFVVRQDGVLLLVTGDDDFDAFFQVGLADGVAVVADGAQGRFIDDIGQFGAGSPGGHAGDSVEVDVVAEGDFLGVGLEDGFTASQVRQFDRDAAVETAWPQQGRVQRFRPVRRGQDDDVVIGVETVHFRQQLVQRLFPFAVAHGIARAFLADGVDFVDEDDARCLLLGDHKSVFAPMKYIQQGVLESKEERQKFRHAPRFAPAGQSTQVIVGATSESDKDILFLSSALYGRPTMKRVYYSGYVSVNTYDKRLPALKQPPLVRENRLYQADWLLRFYQFKVDEIVDDAYPDLDLEIDPKLSWALRHPEQFPVDINKADYEMLLRVPGVGVKSAKLIVASRRFSRLGFYELKKIGVVMKKAQYFITCKELPLQMLTVNELSPQRVRSLLLPKPKKKVDERQLRLDF